MKKLTVAALIVLLVFSLAFSVSAADRNLSPESKIAVDATGIQLFSGQINENEAVGMAIDGNIDTKWCCLYADSLMPTELIEWDHYFIVDLGEVKRFSGYVIHNASLGTSDKGQTQYDTSGWIVATSPDNFTWTDLETVTGNTADKYTFTCEKPFATRYVRLIITAGEQAGTGTTVRLPEFEILGSDIEKVAVGYRNLCLTATISDTSGYINEAESTSLLIDGTTDTKWCATIDNSVMDDEMFDICYHYATIDFGAQMEIKNYILTNASLGLRDIGQTTYDAYAWIMQVSDDGENWTEFDNVTDNTLDKYEFELASPVKGRYVRILVVEPEQAGGTTVRLPELEIWGDTVGGSAPAPAPVVETPAPAAEAPAPAEEAPAEVAAAPAAPAPVTAAAQTFDMLFAVIAVAAASGTAVIASKKK